MHLWRSLPSHSSSMARIIPGAPSVTTSVGARSPRGTRPRPCPASPRSAHAGRARRPAARAARSRRSLRPPAPRPWRRSASWAGRSRHRTAPRPRPGHDLETPGSQAPMTSDTSRGPSPQRRPPVRDHAPHEPLRRTPDLRHRDLQLALGGLHLTRPVPVPRAARLRRVVATLTAGVGGSAAGTCIAGSGSTSSSTLPRTRTKWSSGRLMVDLGESLFVVIHSGDLTAPGRSVWGGSRWPL